MIKSVASSLGVEKAYIGGSKVLEVNMAIRSGVFIGELEVDLPNGKTTRYSIYEVDGGLEVVGPNLERHRLHQGIRRIEHVMTEIAGRHRVGLSSVRQVLKSEP